MADIDDIFSNFKKKKKEEMPAAAKAGDAGTTAAATGAKKKVKKKKADADAAADGAPPAKKKKVAEGAGEKKAAAQDDVAKRTLVIDDSEFFDLRGDRHGGEIDAALGIAPEEENTELRYVAVGNLQPSVEQIYGEIFRERLNGLAIDKIIVDWVSHVVRITFATPAEALAGASMLDRQSLFQRKIKVGLTATRDGEVLIRNILSHVTEDVITQYMSRYGAVVATKLLSHHAVWSKAYVQYADEAHAVKAVKAMHAARNTFQDQPIFLSTTRTTTEEAARKKANKKIKRPVRGGGKGGKGGGAGGDESSDDAPFVYDPNAHYA